MCARLTACAIVIAVGSIAVGSVGSAAAQEEHGEAIDPGDAPGDASKKTNRKGEPTDKLTPVPPPVPPQHEPQAYQLYWEVDAPLLTIAIAFGIGHNIRGGLAPAYCAPAPGSAVAATTMCDPQSLNWLDRKVAGRYQPGWTRWSDVGQYGLEALAAGGLLVDEGLRAGLNDLVVVAEATELAAAAAGASTAMTGRPRPYMYGTTAPLSVRQDGNGGLSYFSGHTTTSFGVAVSAFVTLHRLHPDARWPWLGLAGSSAVGGFVAATRVLAGAHFPTDVLVGAAVGTGIGLMVPTLHGAPRRITPVPMAVASGGGLAIAGELF